MRDLLEIIGLLLLSIIALVLLIVVSGLMDAIDGEPNWLCAILTVVIIVAVVVVRKLRRR